MEEEKKVKEEPVVLRVRPPSRNPQKRVSVGSTSSQQISQQIGKNLNAPLAPISGTLPPLPPKPKLETNSASNIIISGTYSSSSSSSNNNNNNGGATPPTTQHANSSPANIVHLKQQSTFKPPLPEKPPVPEKPQAAQNAPTPPAKPILPLKPRREVPVKPGVTIEDSSSGSGSSSTTPQSSSSSSSTHHQKISPRNRSEIQRRASEAIPVDRKATEQLLSTHSIQSHSNISSNVVGGNNAASSNNNAAASDEKQSQKFIKAVIEKFGNEFGWFASNWANESESKKEEYTQSLNALFQSFHFSEPNSSSSSSSSSSAPSSSTSSSSSGSAQPAISPYLHMSIKEKWAKTDSNLSVNFSSSRVVQVLNLVLPLQTIITNFITSTYSQIHTQIIIGEQSSSSGETVNQIIPNLISVINQIIELVTEEGNSSVSLINNVRKQIMDKINSTSFEGIEKDHIMLAAQQSHNPKYVNKLVLIRLNTIISRLRSLIVQAINVITSFDKELVILPSLECLNSIQLSPDLTVDQTFTIDHRAILEVLSCLRLATSTVKKASDQLATSLALEKLIVLKDMEKDHQKKQSFKIFKKETTESPDNIYKFNVNRPKLEGWEEGAGTLNSLVLKLTSTESIDQLFMKSFIMTYPSFTTTDMLFSKCLERYDVPKHISSDEKKQIQLRVCIVFKYWIENKIKDFDDKTIAKFYDFLEQLKCDGHIDISKMLKTTFDNKAQQINEIETIMMPKIQVFELRWSPTDMLMNSSEKDIAEQITLISWRMYKAIDANELLKLAWTKRSTRHRSPNIKAFIKRFNHVSFWVPTIILFHERLKDRSKVITKFISIAQELRKLNNFDGMMYIISGLRNSSVDRLKFSKFTVNDVHLDAFEELAETMNPMSNWKSYRDTLRVTSLPAIPFMGVYLTDLTFIEDGNPDTYRDGELINFNKRQMVYKVLQEVQLYQTVAYQIEPKEPLLSYLVQMPFLEESDLYYLSSQREPRNATIKDLL